FRRLDVFDVAAVGPSLRMILPESLNGLGHAVVRIKARISRLAESFRDAPCPGEQIDGAQYGQGLNMFIRLHKCKPGFFCCCGHCFSPPIRPFPNSGHLSTMYCSDASRTTQASETFFSR